MPISRQDINARIAQSLNKLRRFVVGRHVEEPPRDADQGSPPPPRAADQPERTSRARDDARQVFERILRHPDETCEERAEALRMDRNREWRARNLVSKHGLIEVAGKATKLEFFEPTKKGTALARERGIPMASFKSKTMHEVLLVRTFRSVEAGIAGVTFTNPGETNRAQSDGLACLPGGIRIPIQVSVTNSAAYEARCLRRLAEHPAMDKVLLVAVSKTKAKAIEKKLKEKEKETEVTAGRNKSGQDDGWRQKIRIIDAASVIEGRVNWAVLLGCEACGTGRPATGDAGGGHEARGGEPKQEEDQGDGDGVSEDQDED